MSGDKTKLSKEIVQNIINNSRKILYVKPMEIKPRKDRDQKKGE